MARSVAGDPATGVDGANGDGPIGEVHGLNGGATSTIS
jgi:hypothetical protein